MAKYKGGYQIVSLLGVLVSASLSGTFNAKEMLTKIKGSNLKRIVLTDLVVNGEKKNDIEVQYELDETNKTIVLKGVYDYQITIDYSESVTSATIRAEKVVSGSPTLSDILEKHLPANFTPVELSFAINSEYGGIEIIIKENGIYKVIKDPTQSGEETKIENIYMYRRYDSTAGVPVVDESSETEINHVKFVSDLLDEQGFFTEPPFSNPNEGEWKYPLQNIGSMYI